MKRLLLALMLAASAGVACTTTSGLMVPTASPDGKRVTARQYELTYYCFWFSIRWIEVECEVTASDILRCRKLNPSFQLREGVVVEGKKI